MNTLRKTAMLALGALAVLASQVFFAAPGSGARAAAPDDVPRSIAPYFKTATSSPKAPDADGFLQRWLLLEPINKPNRTNTVFTDSYVRNAFNTEYFPNQSTVIPHDGDKVKVGDQELAWHALNKGRNVIRGAVINGPGLSDFCVRFIDENGDPVKDLTVSLDNAGK